MKNFLVIGIVFSIGLTGCGRSTDSSAEIPKFNESFSDAQQGKELGTVRGTQTPFQNPIGQDSWRTESASDKIQHTLDALISELLYSSLGSGSELSTWFDAGIVSTELAPSKIPSSNSKTTLGEFTRFDTSSMEFKYQGRSAVSSILRRHLTRRSMESVRHKLKTTSIDPIGLDVWKAGFVISISGKINGQMEEQHMRWQTEWVFTEPKRAMLKKIQLTEMERMTASDKQTCFQECTPSILSSNKSYTQQILKGQHDYDRILPSRLGLDWADLRGIGLGDANGDGLEDLYFCERSGVPNKLFIQGVDGRLMDATEQWGMDWIDDSRSVLFADLDNDGDQDLAVGIYGGVALFSNEANARYDHRGTLSTSESVMQLASADYDLDGKLDLYVCAYNPNELLQDRVTGLPVGVGIQHNLYDSNAGGSNHLFKNSIDGRDWSFEDVTEISGMDQNNERFSLAASWEDFDNDGDQDLYVANDFGRNCLYRNDLIPGGNPSFMNIAPEFSAEDQASGMSVSWGDFNRDGWMDLYIANMWSSAGQRIIPQSNFNPGISEETRGAYYRFALGNTLLKNHEATVLEDVTDSANVSLGRWAWSSPFIDINNDGWEDIFVANGYITGHSDSGDL